MKKCIILIGLLLLIALPAGVMAACTGNGATAAVSSSCVTACPKASSGCSVQATCADQANCPEGGLDCGVTGCAASPSCVSAGCSDGTSCQQMQAYCTKSTQDFYKNRYPGVAARNNWFSQFIRN